MPLPLREGHLITDLLQALLAAHPAWQDGDPLIRVTAPGAPGPTKWVRVDVLRHAVRWGRDTGPLDWRMATYFETICR